VSSNGTAKPNHALMDHHGDSLPKGILQEDFGYIEILSSEALRRFPFYSGDGLGAYLDSVKQGWPVVTPSFMESINTKVLVVDERIQITAWKEKYKNRFEYHLLYKKAGIDIPDPKKDVNLSATVFSKKAKDLILDQIRKGVEDYDYIVIHYGLLERWLGSDPKVINEFIEEELDGKARIIIISDRGVLNDLTTSACFVSFSSVNDAMVVIRSKYLLNNLLSSARRVAGRQ
jgi:hypothetical protein